MRSCRACGAFAVIRLCTYFIAYFALCAALPADGKTLACMGLGFVLERALSGFAVAAFPLAKDTGLAHTFTPDLIGHLRTLYAQ